MLEEYLHFLWRHKRLPFHQFQLVDGSPLEIIDVGQHNADAGPDFFKGKINVGGLTWVGNIELHLKSSDWYQHKHQFDPSYNNIILHVVLEHDREVEVEGRILPTLELKKHVDWKHFEQYQQLQEGKQWIACQNQVQNIDPIFVQEQIQWSVFSRLQKKAKQLSQQQSFYQGDLLSVYYEQFAKVFGLKVNELPFLELISKLPVQLLWRLNRADVQFVALGVGGFFQASKKLNLTGQKPRWEQLKQIHDLEEMEFFSWKYKGLRPVSHPHIRVVQFAEFCADPSFFRAQNLSNTELIAKVHLALNYSEILKNNILINAYVPFFWWLGAQYDQHKFQERSLDLLHQCRAEKNTITRNWKKLGVQIKNSYDTQGLLELKNDFCLRKKCLSCKIGYQVLNT